MNLEDEWEYLYLDDLNPVEELLVILPGVLMNVMYFAKSINYEIGKNRVTELKDEYKKFLIIKLYKQ